jgi:hypothetical protein
MDEAIIALHTLRIGASRMGVKEKPRCVVGWF